MTENEAAQRKTVNEYRNLATLFSQATKTLETLAEIEDIKLMFGEDHDSVEREKELLKEFKGQLDKIIEYLNERKGS